MQGGVRQGLLIQLATIDRDDSILLAPDDERGRLDAAQIGGQFRVVEVWLPAQARGHLAIAPLHVLFFGGELAGSPGLHSLAPGQDRKSAVSWRHPATP